jgi:argininosuccinate synthase
VAIKWMRGHYGLDVIAVSVDVGEEANYEAIRQKALRLGALKAEVVDGREEFVRDFVFPALKSNALYEGRYPVSTALARPLIAKLVGEVARREGAEAVAHGSTGKGNDQVRFEVTFGCLFPELRVLAPIRDWGMTRDQEIEYAEQHGIPIPVEKKSPYSYDTNLWGKSAECGVLEDPWVEPPAEVHQWTVDPDKAPDEPEYVEIGFSRGEPVSLNGALLGPVELITTLNARAGAHGVGRVDMVENRLVGIKSRETYECPAALTLLAAHRDLEGLCLERELAHYKSVLELKYAELVYYGLWYSPLRQALDAFMTATQQTVNGDVRVKLHKGAATPVGRRSPTSLYRLDLATYDVGDRYDQSAAKGFIDIFGMSARLATQLEERTRRP